MNNDVKERAKEMEKEWINEIKTKLDQKKVKIKENLNNLSFSRVNLHSQNQTTNNENLKSVSSEYNPKKTKSRVLSFESYSPRKIPIIKSNNENDIITYLSTKIVSSLR